MKYLLYILTIFILLVVIFGILVPLGFGWLSPSVFLLIILSMSIEYESLDFLFVAIISGLWLDVYFGLPIGTFALAYLIIGFGSFLAFRQLFFSESRSKYFLPFVLVAEIFFLLWLWMYTSLLSRAHWSNFSISASGLIHHAALTVVLALLAAFPIYALVSWVGKVVNELWHKPLQLS